MLRQTGWIQGVSLTWQPPRPSEWVDSAHYSAEWAKKYHSSGACGLNCFSLTSGAMPKLLMSGCVNYVLWSVTLSLLSVNQLMTQLPAVLHFEVTSSNLFANAENSIPKWYSEVYALILMQVHAMPLSKLTCAWRCALAFFGGIGKRNNLCSCCLKRVKRKLWVAN